MSAHEGQQKSTAKSVTARALSVLGVLTAQNPSLTLSEISRACGLPVATVYRLAGELEEARFLERDSSGRYSLGVRMWEMGLLTPVHGHLREAAMPFLLNLQYECRETVQLAVCDGVDAVYIEKLSLDTKTPVQSRIGARIPMHATAVGQAILAFSEPSFIDVITSMALTRFTDATMTTPRAIQKNLAAVRDRGYAISTEEYVMGSTAIAAPVLVAGKVEAAIGIVNYELRDDLERFAPAMVAAATEFGRRLEELANLSAASGKN
jgi:DNA-binding IclR family transcriptional regulator